MFGVPDETAGRVEVRFAMAVVVNSIMMCDVTNVDRYTISMDENSLRIMKMIIG